MTCIEGCNKRSNCMKRVKHRTSLCSASEATMPLSSQCVATNATQYDQCTPSIARNTAYHQCSLSEEASSSSLTSNSPASPDHKSVLKSRPHCLLSHRKLSTVTNYYFLVFFTNCLALFVALVLALILQVASNVKQIFTGSQRMQQQNSEGRREAEMISNTDQGIALYFS